MGLPRSGACLVVTGCLCLIASCSGGGDNDEGTGTLSRVQFDEATAALTGARQKYEETLSQSTAAAALQTTVDWIVTQPGIAEAHIGQDGTTLSFRHTSGLKGTLKTRLMDDDGAGLHLLSRAWRSTSSAALGTGKKAFVAEAPVFRMYAIGNDLATALETAGFEVQHVAATAFTREELKNLGGYDVAIVRGHGSIDWWGDFSIAIGEEATWLDTMQENFVHWDLDGVGVTSSAGDEAIGTFYDIYPKFFERNVIFGSGSVLYLSSCLGLKNDSLAKVLVAKGLGILVGWSDIISARWEYEHTAGPLFDVLLKGASVPAALQELAGLDPDFGRSEWREDDESETINASILTYPTSPSELRIVPGCDATEDCGSGGDTCQDHQCSVAGCTPKVRMDCCGPRVCWFDSCNNQGDEVEACPNGCQSGKCVPSTCPDTQDCTGLECGPDPVCGESCGTCGDSENCTAAGACVPKVPVCPGAKDCSGQVCGPDPVCGESCGSCAPFLHCAEGQCVAEALTCERVGDWLAWPQDHDCSMCESGLWAVLFAQADTQCIHDCLNSPTQMGACMQEMGVADLCSECVTSCGPITCPWASNITVSAGKIMGCGFDQGALCDIGGQLGNGTLCPAEANADLSLCPRVVVGGNSAELLGRHFTGGALVSVKVQGPGGLLTVAANRTVTPIGSFSEDWSVPASLASGEYLIWAESSAGVVLTPKRAFWVQ